jgi:hypothetical protein
MLKLAVPAGTWKVELPGVVNDWLTTLYAGLSGQFVADAGVEVVATIAATVVPPTSEIVAITRTAR